jgi:hypothetical protein
MRLSGYPHIALPCDHCQYATQVVTAARLSNSSRPRLGCLPDPCSVPPTSASPMLTSAHNTLHTTPCQPLYSGFTWCLPHGRHSKQLHSLLIRVFWFTVGPVPWRTIWTVCHCEFLSTPQGSPRNVPVLRAAPLARRAPRVRRAAVGVQIGAVAGSRSVDAQRACVQVAAPLSLPAPTCIRYTSVHTPLCICVWVSSQETTFSAVCVRSTHLVDLFSQEFSATSDDSVLK